jgi:hypothetical protein
VLSLRQQTDCHYACVTIALLIKVSDGLVLASDSATTLMMPMPEGTQAVGNIYNNANKVFNLHKGMPIGAMTWGLGNIGPASVATLAKDLRRRFHGEDATNPDWAVNPAAYSVGELASRAREFLTIDRFEKVQAAAEQAGVPTPILGFLVAGYSSEEDQPRA